VTALGWAEQTGDLEPTGLMAGGAELELLSHELEGTGGAAARPRMNSMPKSATSASATRPAATRKQTAMPEGSTADRPQRRVRWANKTGISPPAPGQGISG
jgi:hypothetical protein